MMTGLEARRNLTSQLKLKWLAGRPFAKALAEDLPGFQQYLSRSAQMSNAELRQAVSEGPSR